MTMLRDFVRYLLVNRLQLPRENFTVQGFGFMRLRVSPTVRVHVWDSRLRIPGVSDIHDHAQWAFTSTVLSGQIVNVRFSEVKSDPRYNCGVINCGMGGGASGSTPTPVNLIAQRPEVYETGDGYLQEPAEIHRTYAADGTVTVIEQDRRPTETARVFWPIGTQWVDAIPRVATVDEIHDIGQSALSIWR